MGMKLAVLARQFNTSVSVISASAKMPVRTKSTGRPRKTSAIIDRVITRISKNHPRMASTEINRELQEFHHVKVNFFYFSGVFGRKTMLFWLQVSKDTVKRRLRDAGLFGRRPVKKPWISEKNRKVRLQWAKDHLHWTTQQWAQVLWSDESKYLLIGTDGIKYVRRPKGTRFLPKYQVATVKHGGGSVMV